MAKTNSESLKLKKLIEDLLLDKLTEQEIKKSMEQVGVKYSEIATTRWKLLLEKLDSNQQQETNL